MSNNPLAPADRHLTITNNAGWILDVILSDRGLEIAVVDPSSGDGLQIGLVRRYRRTIAEFLREYNA